MADISDERQFLHDLSSPLGTALLLLELITKKVEQWPHAKAADVDQMRMIFESLEKIRKLIVARRNYIEIN